jgi:hypothetical protein
MFQERNMNEIELNGSKYQYGKLDALTQFHVARRLMPFFATLLEAVTDLRKSLPADFDFKSATLEDVSSKVNIFEVAAGPISDVLSKMSDEDVDYIIKRCLTVCRKLQGDSWAVIIVKNQFMFELDLPTMIGLVIAVAQGFLGSLFPTEQQPSAS